MVPHANKVVSSMNIALDVLLQTPVYPACMTCTAVSERNVN